MHYFKAKKTKAGQSSKGKRELLESGKWCSKEKLFEADVSGEKDLTKP